MKTIIITCCSVLLLTSARAQDSCEIQATTYYAENVYPVLKSFLLSAKQELHAFPAGSHNMDLADVSAGLLELDSAMFYINKELAVRDITEHLTDYKMLFLFMKDPAMYKKFVNNVYFGRYSKGRYVRSDLSMNYIERQLFSNQIYAGWALHYKVKNVNGTREENKSINIGLRQVAKYMEKHLSEVAPKDFGRNGKIPTNSKDGSVPARFAYNDLKSNPQVLNVLIADKTAEMEALLEKREIPDIICSSVDAYLLEHGKPQRYGTQTGKENGEIVFQTPHDSEKDMNLHRKLVGLGTLEEEIDRIKKIENDSKMIEAY